MKKILIAAYSNKLTNQKENPKNYPYWDQLIKLLKENEYYIIQILTSKETPLKDLDEYLYDRTFKEIMDEVNKCDIWISVDSFLPHLIHSEKLDKQGIVIFSQSDPNIFGYPENINLLKNRKYLRKDQFNIWEQTQHCSKAYVSPNIIFKEIEKVLQLKTINN